MSGWSDARVALARRLYIEQGLSAAETARILGDCSKNAVIGLAHRQGWRREAKVARANMGRVARAKQAAKPRPAAAPRPQPKPQFQSGGELAPWVGGRPDMDRRCPPQARRVVLGLLETGQCRWPLGDVAAPGSAQTLFCGAPVKGEGSSWCPCHAQRVRHPIQPAPYEVGVARRGGGWR